METETLEEFGSPILIGKNMVYEITGLEIVRISEGDDMILGTCKILIDEMTEFHTFRIELPPGKKKIKFTFPPIMVITNRNICIEGRLIGIHSHINKTPGEDIPTFINGHGDVKAILIGKKELIGKEALNKREPK